MRKIYTVVFALMVLLSVTMSAMAAPAPVPDGDSASLEIVESTSVSAPAGDTAPLEDEAHNDTIKNSLNNIRA